MIEWHVLCVCVGFHSSSAAISCYGLPITLLRCLIPKRRSFHFFTSFMHRKLFIHQCCFQLQLPVGPQPISNLNQPGKGMLLTMNTSYYFQTRGRRWDTFYKTVAALHQGFPCFHRARKIRAHSRILRLEDEVLRPENLVQSQLCAWNPKSKRIIATRWTFFATRLWKQN